MKLNTEGADNGAMSIHNTHRMTTYRRPKYRTFKPIEDTYLYDGRVLNEDGGRILPVPTQRFYLRNWPGVPCYRVERPGPYKLLKIKYSMLHTERVISKILGKKSSTTYSPGILHTVPYVNVHGAILIDDQTYDVGPLLEEFAQCRVSVELVPGVPVKLTWLNYRTGFHFYWNFYLMRIRHHYVNWGQVYPRLIEQEGAYFTPLQKK